MNIAFLGFILILCIEYLGLARFIPILNSLHVTSGLAVVLFLWVVSKHGVQEILKHKQTKLLLLFIFLTFLSMFHAFVKTYSYESFRTQIAYFLFFCIGYYLLRDFRRMQVFASAFILLHVILVIRNLSNFLSMSGERIGAFNAGYFLGDGNDFGWGLNIALPFALYGIISSRGYLMKLLSAFALAAISFGIIGTASRGAALAMAGSLSYFWIRSNKKIWGAVFVILLVTAIFSYAQDIFFERMSSLQHYEEDSSAVGRITAWKAAIQMAIDNPIFGVGAGNFNSSYGRFYRVESSSFHNPSRWISAHSIYFLVLGEYGILGLIVIITLLYFIYKENKTSKELILANKDKVTVPAYWPDYINMSLIGYIIGGLFLGGLAYPHIYVITFLTLCTKYVIKSELKKDVTTETQIK